MADSAHGVDNVDSIHSQDSGPKQTDKKKSRRPASESPRQLRWEKQGKQSTDWLSRQTRRFVNRD